MRIYQLYLVEDEFASHYFGKEQLLFQLFLQKEQACGELKAIVEKQVEYITKPLSSLRIQKMLGQKLGKNKDFHHENGVYYLERNGIESMAKLEIFERHGVLEATGNYEAETSFFEALRQCESTFLAVDIFHRRYGWLNPIKERKFV